jgi:phage terminase large subunit
VEELGLSGFYTVRKTSVIGANGTAFVFTGLRHHISKIKSFEGADIVWVEEGQTVSKHSFDVLIPTIRRPGSEIALSRDEQMNGILSALCRACF